jgi:hypothetical protein
MGYNARNDEIRDNVSVGPRSTSKTLPHWLLLKLSDGTDTAVICCPLTFS